MENCNKLIHLNLDFKQGLLALDMLQDVILDARKNAKTNGLDNFFFDCRLPSNIAGCDNSFARVMCQGDVYNISFYRGIHQPGIVSITKTLH